MITDYAVTGMTCEHCEQRVQRELAEVPGVADAVADAATGRVRVTSDGPVDADAVADAIDEAGYELVRG